MKKKQLIVAAAFVGIIPAVAQKMSKDSTRVIDEVVVTGSKTSISRKIVPLAVSQISQKEIESTGQYNILPVLNYYTPGIFVTERNIMGFGVSAGGSGAITMRGIGNAPNTDILVLIDGNPQYQGIFGHPLADAYVASDVEKVEVIHGPASILYGSNAMAGVVNIITKKQHQEGLKATLGASYGSYNTQKYDGTLGYHKNKLNLFASLNHDESDGIRANTDFNINNGYFKAGYDLSKNLQVTADVSLAKFDANDNGAMYKVPAAGVAANSVLASSVPFHIDILRGKSSLSVENKFDKLEGAVKVFTNWGDHTLSSRFHSTDFNTGAMLYETYRFNKQASLTAGLDFKNYGGTVSDTASNIYKTESVRELAAYVYGQYTFFEKLTASAGVRLDNNSKFGNEWVPIGGLTYSLNGNTTFKASVSKGFRSPTIMEMYLYAPNPDLQPERMMNYELSWIQSLLSDRLNLELTAFKVKGDNMIQVVVPPVPAKRQNVGSFDNKGIEFSAKYAVCKNLFLHANYSYLDLKKPVVAAPRQQLNVSANYSYKVWSLNVSTQYIEKLYTYIPGNATIAPVVQPDYLLLNARLSCRPKQQLEVFVAGNNLLDQQYQINYGYPMPGANFNAGFNLKF